jgi:hypothetical protein
LLSLLTSGNTDGMEPAGVPWLLDSQPDQAQPADTGTAAKLQLSLLPLPCGCSSQCEECQCGLTR